MREKQRLGDLLVQSGALSPERLATALEKQDSNGGRLGGVIVSLGYMTEEGLVRVLSHQLSVSIADPEYAQPPVELLGAIPESIARKLLLFPMSLTDSVAVVAMADPLDLSAIDEVAAKLARRVETAIATESQIMRAIDGAYGFLHSLDRATRSQTSSGPVDMADVMPPIARLVETIIAQGARDRASDVHIEPVEEGLRIRYRIDGAMFTETTLAKNLEAAIVSRIKVMAKIDIAETRVPQEGAAVVSVNGARLELRVSAFPTIYGESVVIRILNRDTTFMRLDQTGLSGMAYERFTGALSGRQGIVIVTGPTGSGKTTTLYAALAAINTPERTIVTIEDPVEYRLKGVRQSQINPKAGLTFARGLRSILRQDPDVIMVGEIRDSETAEISVRAAMTGHLVLSTLHTGDTVGAVARLIDLGAESSLVASTLNGVLTQRLVRTICGKCQRGAEALNPDPENLGMAAETPAPFGKHGCPRCRNSGYFGRTGVFEFLGVDEGIRDRIASGVRPALIRKYARQAGLITGMRDDGVDKVKRGLTTIEEVNRAASEA